jgi:rod shape-determining protein MreC
MEENPRHLGEMVDQGLRRALRTVRRLAYVGFALTAFGLILLGKIDARMIDSLRALIADATAPALDTVSYPLSLMREAVDDLAILSDLREENRRLREENGRLAQLRLAAHRLREENTGLRRLLRFDPGPAAASISTRVVADTGGVFARSVMVHVGTENGLRHGLPVIGASGLVGRVQSLGNRAARVLLITDLNSKIPVAIGDGRLRAIMAGRNEPHPALEFFTDGDEPAEGELVVTSGDGGMFYPGLPIGIVRTSGGGAWRVQPFTDWNLLDYVRIVDYGDRLALNVAAGEERQR